MAALERMAKAMEERLYEMEQGDDPPDCYRRLGEGEYRDLVRAALMVIREPTMAMRRVSSFTAAEIDWPAMIDAILNEAP